MGTNILGVWLLKGTSPECHIMLIFVVWNTPSSERADDGRGSRNWLPKVENRVVASTAMVAT